MTSAVHRGRKASDQTNKQLCCVLCSFIILKQKKMTISLKEMFVYQFSYVFLPVLVWLLFNVPVNSFSVIWDGATASWVFTSTLESLKCLAQGHYTSVVGFETWISRSGVRRSTSEPPFTCESCKVQVQFFHRRFTSQIYR